MAGEMDISSTGVFTAMGATGKQHEVFSDLNEFIEENYSLWLTVHFPLRGQPDLPVRIYLLKQRMQDLRLSPEEIVVPQDKSVGSN